MTDMMVSVTGVTKITATRAIRYLRARSVCAFYSVKDKSLNCFPLKPGNGYADPTEYTRDVLIKALRVTANN